jgi:hypothetical protein
MRGKIRVRFAVLAALAALAALLATTATASADPEKNYLIEVTPAVAADNSIQQFNVRFTNVDGNNPLGGIELYPAVSTLNGEVVAFSLVPPVEAGDVSVSDPTNLWSATVVGETVRLLAADPDSRLSTGEWIELAVTYSTPDVDALNVENDIDLVFDFPSEARQANNFNAGGNDFFPVTQDRDDPVTYRDGDGFTDPVFLQSNQVLVVSGTTNDCSVDCSGTDTQTGITVEISVENCDTGTLVVDATDLFAGASDIISGVYNYLPVSEFETCFDPEQLKRVFIDYTIPGPVARDLGVKAKDITAVAYYGIDITGYDPDYVGDGEILPECDDVRTFNCAVPASNGPNGIEAETVLILLPTDPGTSLYR